MSINLPTGTVTFLFTEIEGSTRLWQGQSLMRMRQSDWHWKYNQP